MCTSGILALTLQKKSNKRFIPLSRVQCLYSVLLTLTEPLCVGDQTPILGENASVCNSGHVLTPD